MYGDRAADAKRAPTAATSLSRQIAPPQPPTTLASRLKQKVKQFSLKAEADRRLKRQPGLATISSAAKFVDSKIVVGEAASVLYACLPVLASGAQAVTQLLYRSSDYPSPNMASFIDRYRDAVLPPTVVLVRSGQFVFGGYAAESWIFDGQYGGNPRGFLFSITHDCKIPYHGRVKGPDQDSDAETARQFEEHQISAYT